MPLFVRSRAFQSPLWIALVNAGFAGAIHAGVTLVGSPAYDPLRGGYGYPQLSQQPGHSVSNGVAVFGVPFYRADGTSTGQRPMRLRGDGQYVEMEVLGSHEAGSNHAIVNAIGNDGVSVGQVYRYDAAHQFDGTRAVTWSPSGVVTELASLSFDGGDYTRAAAHARNDNGVIVGYADRYDDNAQGDRPARWASNGLVTELGSLGTDDTSYADGYAYAINNTGTSVGATEKYTETHTYLGERAVRWAATGSTAAIELDNLGVDSHGETVSGAWDINAAGVSVGFADRYDLHVAKGRRPVRWAATGTAATELGVLGVSSTGQTTAEARDINTAGDAAGYVTKYNASGASQGTRAVRWNANTTAAVELDPLGGTASEAYAINDAGAAVGYSKIGGVDKAMLWLRNGAAINLNSLLAGTQGFSELSFANAISEEGWISGIGLYQVGDVGMFDRAFLMLVPQAGTYGIGDANFDSKVNFTDLVIVAQNYNKPNPSHASNVGDFDLNGKTEFQDLVTLAQHYNFSGGSSLAGAASPEFASDWTLAQSLVPEPTIALCFVFSPCLIRRRK